MSSYRQILLHIVFRIKNGKRTLSREHHDKLFRYVWGTIRGKGCFLYRINGMEDHIHILTDLSPSLALADYIRDIKTSSSIWLKRCGFFPNFEGWATGYGCFSYSVKDKYKIINYIKNQQIHHSTTSFEEEYRKLLKEHNIHINERYFLK